MVEGAPVLLAKPQTFMNLSGESVSVHRFKTYSYFLALAHCLVHAILPTNPEFHIIIKNFCLKKS
jgi:Peptidyl-tRNA hydrolase